VGSLSFICILPSPQTGHTRLPKLYFANAANLLLQYNLKWIEPLPPRGMSGQDEQGTMEFRGEEETCSELAEGDPHDRLVPP
jgi:hypothetical protein